MDLPVKFIQSFGVIQGILLYLRFKLHLTRKLKVPGLLHPICLRPGTIDQYTFREVFLMKDYDLPYQPDETERPVIVDGGANIGISSVFSPADFPHAIIECFEPEDENYALLVKNTEAYPNIRAHKSALWWKSGFVSVIDKGYGLRGFITEETGKHDQVPALSLEDLLIRNNYQYIHILKMDIEGSEKDLFDHNPEKWLPRIHYLIIELHDSMRPGSSMSFFKALSPYQFNASVSGENLIIEFHH